MYKIMNKIESEEAFSDDTNIISELLNSDEAMQTSSLPINNAGSMKMPLQQNDELQIFSNTRAVAATFFNTKNQNIMVSLQQNHSMIPDGISNSNQHSDIGDLNKMHIRHVHIPYILNGELYQIQTQDGENVTVKCCHCPPDRVYRGSVRSTGNFHMHIKRRHPDLLEKLHDMKVNALLERRDRLMRNRKINHRNSRNRSNNSITSSNDMSFKNEENPELTKTTPGSQITLDSTTEPSVMHTHKLKIKTVFQRHQMQQRQAEEMRNWSNAGFVVMPIGKIPENEESELPINYSLKSQENHVISSKSLNINQQLQPQLETKETHITTHQTSFDSFTNLINHPTNLCSYNATEQSENHTNIINLSCPSDVSSYASSHQCEIETDQANSSYSLQHHNLSAIKPEQFVLGEETEAIDLTIHTDSGIFSSSEDNDSENNNESSINNIRAGTRQSNTANVTMINSEFNGESFNNNGSNGANWQELLVQVQNSLRDIHREMNIRNHIESNRMFLDIAKFKYLNPGFQFNW